MNRWLKIGIIVVIVIVVGIILWQYVQCKKRGAQIGTPYRCGMFNSVPIPLTIVDEYYDMKYERCYHFTDYGDSMSVREVELKNCN